MTPDEFKDLAAYVRALWPAGELNAEQLIVWFSTVGHTTLSRAKQAAAQAYALSKWREPQLASVVEQLADIRKLDGHAPMPELPQDQVDAIMEADRKLKAEHTARLKAKE